MGMLDFCNTQAMIGWRTGPLTSSEKMTDRATLPVRHQRDGAPADHRMSSGEISLRSRSARRVDEVGQFCGGPQEIDLVEKGLLGDWRRR